MACLAIVFTGPRAKNGRRVFDSFLECNRAAFWNPELVSACASLTYMGFMRPGTLFVSATPAQLAVLKSAWARRVLKPASGCQIASLGDMGAISPVEQTAFVPLGDVLCDSIARLNREGRPATLHSIKEHIAANCTQMAPPSLELLRQTVSSLSGTGLIYSMGEHMFVSVPAAVSAAPVPICVDQPEKKEKKSLLAKLFRLKEKEHKEQPKKTDEADWQRCPRLVPDLPLPPQPQSNNVLDGLSPMRDVQQQRDRKRRAHRRAERRQLSGSSECLNYGPIDPPECLPACAELVDDIASRRTRHRRRERRDTVEVPARTSTPVDSSDSAYSPSPVDSMNYSDEELRHLPSEHTYVNCVPLMRAGAGHESTQFEDIEEPTLLLRSPLLLSHV